MKSLIKVGLVYLLTVVLSSAVFAQSLRFAFVTDTHIGNSTGAEDLQRTVHDINGNADLEFVVVTGDITEFGSDTELKTARQILDSLNKPWYVIAGNHDSNWSESGANSFRQVFGGKRFPL
ncbi:metallophosphoesterase [Arcticibacter sp. MXS-1]|uniref:metallophosphoesterase family protein n=1 Tax=Arcticibacter sp. MXS-1 TaxID=3341726 RepID=UPI0035A90E2D